MSIGLRPSGGLFHEAADATCVIVADCWVSGTCPLMNFDEALATLAESGVFAIMQLSRASTW